MILGTNKGEVLGEPGFGANMDDMLFSFDFEPSAFSRALIAQVNMYSELSRDFDIKFGVKRVTLNRSGGDAGLVDIIVNGRSIFGFVFK